MKVNVMYINMEISKILYNKYNIDILRPILITGIKTFIITSATGGVLVLIRCIDR